VTQEDIRDAVDISSATKYFNLTLDKFGPYRIDYTLNGRFLLIGGQKGHLAAFDWQTKKLMCEINVMETIQDVKWLHIETMFAVAQNQWTFIYDNQGVELHCLKFIDSALQLQFLPYHFLLVAATSRSFITWIDVSIGQKVAGFTTGLGRLDVMCQNPQNATILLGHPGGTVSMWSPNVKEPLVKMLCHGSATKSIAVDKTGNYMATSGLDRQLRIWDLRMYKEVHGSYLKFGANRLDFSQRGLLAVGLNDIVQVYTDPVSSPPTTPYLSHTLRRPGLHGMQFCPFEDVLGVGHLEGFTSLLVPGSGEPNYDALEANPYQTKQQRRQKEVKMLLEKVQPDMITLDTSALGKVNVKTLKEKMEEKAKLKFLKMKKIDFEPKYKKKGRSKSGNLFSKELRKQGVRAEQTKHFIRKVLTNKKREETEPSKDSKRKKDVLDRFKSKT
ncbi:hypothetical protein HELRODRAFT_81152, partial [Helobdella robusta]|uniref:WD repeat-containing protein 46 n=1 Tax=Helobdella robusta TaxID=6412 RepID=T1G4A3_HELRO